jgi:hypothetical protein
MNLVIQEFQKLTRSAYKKMSAEQEKAHFWAYGSGPMFSLVPWEAEREELPVGSAISAEKAKQTGYIFGFDDQKRLVVVQRQAKGATTSERFILYAKDGGSAKEIAFNAEKKPVSLAHYLWENGLLTRYEKATKNKDIRTETYHYDESNRLQFIEQTRGTFEKPTLFEYKITIHYNQTGQTQQLDFTNNDGSTSSLHLKPNAVQTQVRFPDLDIKSNPKRQTNPSPANEPPAKDSTNTGKLAADFGELLENTVFDVMLDLDFENKVAAVALVYDEGTPFSGPFLGTLDEKELKSLEKKFSDPLDIWNPAEWDLYDDSPLLLESKKLQQMADQLHRSSPEKERDILRNVATQLRERLSKELETTKTFVVYATDLVQANLREDIVASNPPLVLTALAKKKLWFDK